MKRLLVIVIVFFGTMEAMAQTRIIIGRVIAADDRVPLPGVNIMITGTTRGTSSDSEGNFSLEVEQADVSLQFSFIGYASQTIEIGSRSRIDVELKPDQVTLDDVVIVGYGIVRKSDLTGSVSSLRGGDLTRVTAVSPMQALQGKIAGVQITSASGAPGSGTVVRIRGTGTFNNANPIYVVDGVILDNIDYLSSSDIESMEVLKDASATAIYGSRGANGVIMVTTRQGSKSSEAPVISFNAEYGIQQLNKTIDLLSGREFAIIANEITPGSYNNVDAVPNTDWQNELFQTAPIQNYSFSVTGGNKKSQYYASFGYLKQDGIIPKSNFERMTIKLNNQFSLTNHIRMGSNLTFAPNRRQNTNGNAPFVVYRAQPVIKPYNPDGTYSEVPGVGNVFADIDYTNSFDKGIRGVSNFYGEVDFLKNFVFRTSFGVDMEFNKSKSFTPAFYVSPQQQNAINDLSKGYSDRVSWLWENTLSYAKDFDKHSINAVAGYTMQESGSEYMNGIGQNVLRDGEDFWYLNPDNINGRLFSNGVNLDQNYSMISYLGRVNYVFDKRYLVTFTYRLDGSSKFGVDNRYAGFPSVAVGWNAINESFMQQFPVISNLKLRASWGLIGNEKIRYDRLYSPVLNSVGGVFGTSEAIVNGSTYGVSGNPALKWETTNQYDIGLEIGLIEDALTLELDYFNKTTSDILIDLPVPGYLGNGVGAAITYNAAEVLNRGLEYSLAYKNEWNGIRYKASTVGTFLHNEALKVFGTGGSGDRLPNGSGTTSTSPGLPLGAFYGYEVEGVYQNQSELDAHPNSLGGEVGDLRFRDVDKNGVVNSADRTFIGSPIPKFIMGVNLEVAYKSFDVSVDFQGQFGNKIYNAKETVRPDLYNFEQHVFERWTGEGTSNVEPRSSAGGYNWLPSTRFVQDGSFVRLRTVSVGYTLPTALTEKFHMRNARFYVRGNNLFTVTKFTGYSPEVAGGPIDNGIDSSTYPITTVYSFGFNANF